MKIEIPEIEEKKVLSIQSHVVHGYVGNKAATFPLQTLGWDVDALNSVNFSNHTGYGQCEGTTTKSNEVTELYNGLKNINLKYHSILTGYIHGSDTLSTVGGVCSDLKSRQRDVVWLLDPVMGDEGQLYVDDSVIPTYRTILSKGLVDIVTPNQFEAELIVGFAINDQQSLQKALDVFHGEYKVENVVISSIYLAEFGDKDHLYCLASPNFGKTQSACFKVSLFRSYFTGVGDLFSALLMDRYHRLMKKGGDVLITSVDEVLTVMHKVLYITQEMTKKKLGRYVNGKMGSPQDMVECELRIIECKHIYGERERLSRFVSTWGN